MKKYAVFVFPVIALLSACMWGIPHNPKAAITKDTLGYNYRIIKQHAADCGNKPDKGCTIATIKYPVFTGQKILNDTIANKLIHLAGPNNPDTGLVQLAQNFIKNYDRKIAGGSLSLNIKAIVLRQDSGITTLQLQLYTFRGGTHGDSIIRFINWDTKAKKSITLNDILVNGYEDRLTGIADTIFRRQEKLSDTTSLAANYFFKGNKFALNQNYSITPLGIRFLYNENEIKPYIAGTTDLFIPYSQLKSLLRPNTITAQYIK
jgi:hypothetical protein